MATPFEIHVTSKRRGHSQFEFQSNGSSGAYSSVGTEGKRGETVVSPLGMSADDLLALKQADQTAAYLELVAATTGLVHLRIVVNFV